VCEIDAGRASREGDASGKRPIVATAGRVAEPGAVLIRAMSSLSLNPRSSSGLLLDLCTSFTISSTLSSSVEIASSSVDVMVGKEAVTCGRELLAAGTEGFARNNQERCSSRLLRVMRGEHC
jgi:hypothetical protein